MKRTTKSPLKRKPLRNPGQSLDEEIDKVLDDEFLAYMMTAILISVMAVLEWWRYFFKVPYTPKLYSTVALILIAFSIHKFYKVKKKVEHLKLGRDGERAVGQYLEQLRAIGCRVYHDIIGEDFNLDHLVISEHGIFVVETKTYSKPHKGEAVITVEGDRIKLNKFEAKGNLLGQARAEAAWLTQLLKEHIGKKMPVRPIIVFPGWYVDAADFNKNSDVWILNPKALPTFIKNEPIRFSEQEIRQAASCISRHIRK